jgi:hypothetical protein
MNVIAAIALALLAAEGTSTHSAESIQHELSGYVTTIRTWTSDRMLIDAVKAQNARRMTLDQIQRDDNLWMAGKQGALMQQMTTGPCADHLRQLVATAGFGETFVMDNQGALVCATDKTSDYWQGDEAKWTRAFADGKGATFIDRLRFDDSAKQNLAQISLPIMDGDQAIGVVTVGVTITQVSRK